MLNKSTRVILLSLFFFSPLTPTFSASLKPLICITQIASHPALDTAQRGIVDALKAQGFTKETATITVDVAQAQAPLALQIAQKCVGQGAHVIVALGTTMAQSALKAAKASGTPVVFVSVTDPLSSGLVKNLCVPGENVTGVSDATSSEAQVNMFLELVPKLKSLGVILSPGEANSIAQFAKLEKAAKKKGITLLQGVATKTSDVRQAAEGLVGRVDAFFVDNDNTALAAFSSMVKVSYKSRIPLFVSDTDIVPQGALAALGPDQYDLGKKAGNMVVRILKGEKPGRISVVFPKNYQRVFNNKSADFLKIKLKEK